MFLGSSISNVTCLVPPGVGHNVLMELKLLKLCFLIFLLPSLGQAETWKIATLEWPPYVCSRCYKNGAAAHALREELSKQGITIEFVFYPWVQAQKRGGSKTFVGFFPAWQEEIPEGFMGSIPLFESPVVIVERKDRAIKWSKLADLKGKVFGVTEGYGYTKEFNKLVSEGTILVRPFINEDTVIRKLEAGSIDAVLMDLNVAEFYLEKMTSKEKSKIQINKQVLEYKKLYLAFNEANFSKIKKMEKMSGKFPLQEPIGKFLKSNSH